MQRPPAQPPTGKPSVANASPRGQGELSPSPPSAHALTGVFEVLVNEHRKAAAQLARIAQESAASREQSWPLLRRQLLSHDRAEELEVYPALEGYEAARDIVEQHELQAKELESALGELDAIDYGAEAWIAKFREIVALFEKHVDVEEHEYFPRAQELLGETSARELHARFVSAQRDVIHTLV